MGLPRDATTARTQKEIRAHWCLGADTPGTAEYDSCPAYVQHSWLMAHNRGSCRCTIQEQETLIKLHGITEPMHPATCQSGRTAVDIDRLLRAAVHNKGHTVPALTLALGEQ